MLEENDDSLTPIIKQWDEIDKNDLVETVIPPKSKLDETQQLFQSSKVQLQSLTKSFYLNNTENYPHDEGIRLLTKYDEIFTDLSSRCKENEAAIADLFTKLATVDDPSIIIQMAISKLKNIPDFNQDLADIQKQTENEREKSENVSKLLEQLNDLKKKCDEQIMIAQKTANSQSEIDLGISLSEYQKKKQEVKSELKEIQSQYNSLTLQKESKINELKSKEADFEQNYSNRQEQIDSLMSELNEANKSYQETESQQKEIEESGSLIKLAEQIDSINKEIMEVDRKTDEIQQKIEKTRCQKQDINQQEKIDQLKKSIDSIQKIISEVPSKIEFEKMKNDTIRIQSILEKEKKKKNLESSLSELETQIKSKKSELDSQNRILREIKAQYEKEKSKIDDLISETQNDYNNNELIAVFRSQINDMQAAIDHKRNLTSILIQQNQIKRNTKENLENEVEDLKNRLRNNENVVFDPENTMYSFSNRSSNFNYDFLGQNSQNDSQSDVIDDFLESKNIKKYFEMISDTIRSSCRRSPLARYALFGFILIIHLLLIYIVFK